MGIKGSSLGGTVQLGHGTFLPEASAIIDYLGATYLQSGVLLDVGSNAEIPRELLGVSTTSWRAFNTGAIGVTRCAASSEGVSLIGDTTTSVRRSIDNITWDSVSTENAGQITAIAIEGELAVATSANGSLSISIDAGATWVAQTLGATNFVSATITNGIILVGAAASNLIYRSDDSGVTWTSYTATATPTKMSSSDNVVVAALAGGSIARSTDYGVTFTELAPAATGLPASNPVGISLSGQYGLLIGGDGLVYRTSDFGQIWATVSVTLSGIKRSVSVDGRLAILTNNSGDVAVSLNYGEAWQDFNSVLGTTDVSASALNDGVALVAGGIAQAAVGLQFIGFKEYTKNLYMRIK